MVSMAKVTAWNARAATTSRLVHRGTNSRGERSSAEKVTYVTNPTLDPKLYPPSGQEFFKDYKAKYGKDPEPYAIYGYEAMSVMLQAIQNGSERGRVGVESCPARCAAVWRDEDDLGVLEPART